MQAVYYALETSLPLGRHRAGAGGANFVSSDARQWPAAWRAGGGRPDHPPVRAGAGSTEQCTRLSALHPGRLGMVPRPAFAPRPARQSHGHPVGLLDAVGAAGAVAVVSTHRRPDRQLGDRTAAGRVLRGDLFLLVLRRQHGTIRVGRGADPGDRAACLPLGGNPRSRRPGGPIRTRRRRLSPRIGLFGWIDARTSCNRGLRRTAAACGLSSAGGPA